MASVPLQVELELDRRSATAVANDVERAMADAGRNIQQDFSRTMSGLNSGDMRRVGRDIGNNLRDGIRGSMDEAVRGVTGQFGEMGRAAQSTFAAMPRGASLAAAGVAGIGVAAVAVGKQLYDLGAGWDDVVDGITGRTGMVGAELEALTNTVKDLSSQVAVPISDLGNIAGQVAQSMNLADDAAARVIQTLAQIQQLTGQVVDVRGAGKLFSLFDIEEAEAQSGALEDLLAVSQSTGVGINELMAATRRAGTASKEFGLDFAETAALVATMEDAGLDFTRLAPTLSIALKNLARDGGEPAAQLRATITEIQRLNEAGLASQAVTLTQETFGRGYQDFFDAIKEGRLSAETLDRALDEVGASLDEQIEATEDWQEEWQKLSNSFSTLMSGPAASFFGYVSDQLQNGMSLLEGFRDGILGLGYAWQSVGDFITGNPITVQMPAGPATLDANGNVIATGQPAAGPNPLTGAPGTATAGPPTLDQLLGLSPATPAAPLPLPTTQPAQPTAGLGPNFFRDWYLTPEEQERRAREAQGDSAMPVVPRSGEDPMSLLQGFTPTSSLYGAASSVLDARHARAQAESDLNTLEAANEQDAEKIQAAKNKLLEADQNIYQTELRLQEAKQSALDKYTKQMESASSTLETVGAQLDSDFGVSKGLAGIAENITKFLLNLAMAPVLGALQGVKQASGFDDNSGSGIVGMLGNSGAFGPQFTPAARAAAAGTTGQFGQPAVYNPSQMSSSAIPQASAAAMPGGSARDFAHELMMPFWQSQGFTVGDHAADKYGEHQNGALDIMVDSLAEGNDVLKQVLADPNVYGAIFNNKTYGYGQGAEGRPYGGGFTGNPTQDHQDHVHAWYKPGGANNIAPAGGGGGGGLGWRGGPGSTTTGGGSWASPGIPSSMSGGGGQSPIFGATPSGPGVGGGLGYVPGSSPFAPGGVLGAMPGAPGFTPGIPGAGPVGTAPGQIGPFGVPPGVAPGFGNSASMGLSPGGGVGGWGGLSNQGAAPSQSVPGGRQLGQGLPSSQGISFNGGVIGQAASMAATAAAGAASFGAGGGAGGAAADIGMQLIGRAIGAGGQYMGNLVGAGLETFMLNDSPLADPGKSWIGRLGIAAAGMRPALPNTAGMMGGEQNPNMAEGGKPPPPPLTPGQAEAAKGEAGRGAAAVKERQGDKYDITVNNQRATEDGTGRDIQASLGASQAARQPR